MRGTLAVLVVLSFAPVASAFAQPPATYGMNLRPLSSVQADTMVELGASTARVVFGWDTIEPNCKGCFEWTTTDAWVLDARRTGLRIAGTLAYSPKWANGGRHYSYPPLDYMNWYDFVFAVVSRYRDDVQDWGVWNEPNLDAYWHGSDLEGYKRLATLAASAVRAANPRARVLGPEVSHHAFKDGWYVGAMRSLVDLFDIVTVHWYPDGPDLDFMMDHMVRPHTAGRPVWLTEVGLNPCESPYGETGQALLYNRVLKAMQSRRAWWTGVLFYNLLDLEAVRSCGSGIVRGDLSKRPAFTLYQSVIRAYP